MQDFPVDDVPLLQTLAAGLLADGFAVDVVAARGGRVSVENNQPGARFPVHLPAPSTPDTYPSGDESA